ncbi:Dop1 protein [Martiniozyma asiatica (nom. inval.)]|nr:Dop1 protein [Martiniozyma asiatica]
MMSPLFGPRTPTVRETENGPVQLTSKEKRYSSNVERALASFEAITEWPDYISFLTKLHKALLSNPDISNHWIPYEKQVAFLLAKCMATQLPSGVHRKTLEVYPVVFDIVGMKSLDIWLLGFSGLGEFSINVKELLVSLFDEIITHSSEDELKRACRGLLISLFPGLEEKEIYDPVINLIQKLRKRIGDVHFWQCTFLAIITGDNKEGALEYLTKWLPEFKVEITNRDQILADLGNAKACVTPEGGLLSKAILTGLKDDNVYVVRGFFDLILNKMPLDSGIWSICDKNIIRWALECVLRRDMSLNRRLWSWLLGPGESEVARIEYFKKYAISTIQSVLLEIIEEHPGKASRMCITMMDRWEVGSPIIPHVFVKILKKTFQNFPNDATITKNVSELVDVVESKVIWEKIYELVKAGELDVVEWVLEKFNVGEEEMITIHAPLILCFILNVSEFPNLNVATMLIQLIPTRALLPPDRKFTSINIQEKIDEYYSTDSEVPFSPLQFSSIFIKSIEQKMEYFIQKKQFSEFNKICEVLNLLWSVIPECFWDGSFLINYDWDNISTGVLLIFEHIVSDNLSKAKYLKRLLKSLWVSLLQTKDTVIVDRILKLEMIVPTGILEAALTAMFLTLDPFDQLNMFRLFWRDSTNTIIRPLYIILDLLDDELCCHETIKWIEQCDQDQSLSQIIEIVTKFPDDNASLMYQLSKIESLLRIPTVLLLFKRKSDYKASFLKDVIPLLKNGNSQCTVKILSILGLIIDGSESKFDDLVQNLTTTVTAVTTPHYLELFTSIMKLSSKNQLNVSLFDPSHDTFLKFVTTGLSTSSIPHWFDFILITGEYYSEFLFQITTELTNFVCNYIENTQPPQTEQLIKGLQRVLESAYKYFGLISEGMSKDSGFFETVIQAFQTDETFDDRKFTLLENFRLAVELAYFNWCNGTTNIKFNSRRLIERFYTYEPEEVVEVLIKCYLKDPRGMRVIEGLGNIIGHVISSLVARIRDSTTDEHNHTRSRVKLKDTDISQFMVLYSQILGGEIEDYWNDIALLFKDLGSPYKNVVCDMLKFCSIVGMVRPKEVSDVFGKVWTYFKEGKPTPESCSALSFVLKHLTWMDIEKMSSYRTSIIHWIGNGIQFYSGNVRSAPVCQVELLLQLSDIVNECGKVKGWKTLMWEIINDEGFLRSEGEDLWGKLIENFSKGQNVEVEIKRGIYLINHGAKANSLVNSIDDLLMQNKKLNDFHYLFLRAVILNYPPGEIDWLLINRALYSGLQNSSLMVCKLIEVAMRSEWKEMWGFVDDNLDVLSNKESKSLVKKFSNGKGTTRDTELVGIRALSDDEIRGWCTGAGVGWLEGVYDGWKESAEALKQDVFEDLIFLSST